MQVSTVSIPRAPARTGGFYGVSSRRGQSELKVVDTTTAGVIPVAQAGSVTLLNGVATGTDYTSRIGRKIVLKSILMRFFFFDTTTTSNGDNVRIIIFYDCQTNAAAPAVTDVINVADPLQPMNLNNRDRFLILKDKMITYNPGVYAANVLTGGNPVNKSWKTYKKMSKETIFGGTGATVGSIQSGGLFLLLISTNAQGNLNYNARVRFLDG